LLTVGSDPAKHNMKKGKEEKRVKKKVFLNMAFFFTSGSGGGGEEKEPGPHPSRGEKKEGEKGGGGVAARRRGLEILSLFEGKGTGGLTAREGEKGRGVWLSKFLLLALDAWEKREKRGEPISCAVGEGREKRGEVVPFFRRCKFL